MTSQQPVDLEAMGYVDEFLPSRLSPIESLLQHVVVMLFPSIGVSFAGCRSPGAEARPRC